jgi:hypothetical protein
MIVAREMNEENLEFITFGVLLDAFVHGCDDVFIQYVIENGLDLFGSAGSASVADEKG